MYSPIFVQMNIAVRTDWNFYHHCSACLNSSFYPMEFHSLQSKTILLPAKITDGTEAKFWIVGNFFSCTYFPHSCTSFSWKTFCPCSNWLHNIMPWMTQPTKGKFSGSVKSHKKFLNYQDLIHCNDNAYISRKNSPTLLVGDLRLLECFSRERCNNFVNLRKSLIREN